MPSVEWRSFLFTAAGQFRSLTGFPFHLPCWKNHRISNRLYLEAALSATPIHCGYLAIDLMSPIQAPRPAGGFQCSRKLPSFKPTSSPRSHLWLARREVRALDMANSFSFEINNCRDTFFFWTIDPNRACVIRAANPLGGVLALYNR